MSGRVENLRPAHPEEFELYEYATEGATELNAHVTEHLLTRCAPCTKLLDDIRVLDRARQAREDFDRFFDDMPADDAPPSEQEEFLKKFKRPAGKKPTDRPGRLAYEGREHADKLLAAAAEEDGLEKATALIEELQKDASRGYAYLFFCQMAISTLSKRPATYLVLASRIADAARSLPYRLHRGPAQPVCRESVIAEAALLKSHALNTQGHSNEAREAVQVARENFSSAEDDSFSTALCDVFEGSAATFQGEYKSAWKLLKSALAEFQLYGQQNWIGRAEASLAILMTHRGLNESALYFYDAALRDLHPKQDESILAGIFSNRAYALVQLGRTDAARASYAKALRIARTNGLTVAVFSIRFGLATIELLKGHAAKALPLFDGLLGDAIREGLVDRVVTAELRIAECLGRLGRDVEMSARIDSLRATSAVAGTEDNPALGELFTALDKGELHAGLVAHVASYVEDMDHGVSTRYRPFRLVAGGRQ